MECTKPLCAGTGKCLDQHHVNERLALELIPDAIRAWLKDQELNADFGGVCEHDHDTMYALIEKLLAEMEQLQNRVWCGAKCRDPKRVGCGWSGRLWFEVKPVERCMSCPSCGGFDFQASVDVVRRGLAGKLEGFTA